MQQIKCVFLGDLEVGKTSLLISYTRNTFEVVNVTTLFDYYSKTVKTENEQVNLVLMDTSGHVPYFDRFRPFFYKQKPDACFICFSIVNPESFENVRKTWYPEVRRRCSLAKIFLVGTKLDLRNDEEEIEKLCLRNQKPITYSQGLSMKNEISALQYFECSALNGKGLNLVFEESTRILIEQKKNECIIL